MAGGFLTQEVHSFEDLMPSFWAPRLLEIFGNFLVERHEGFEVLSSSSNLWGSFPTWRPESINLAGTAVYEQTLFLP